MTEFEQQVADALNALFVDAARVPDASPTVRDFFTRTIVPRVAAAIEAATAQTTVNIACAVGPGVIADALQVTPPTVQWHEAALAALRKES